MKPAPSLQERLKTRAPLALKIWAKRVFVGAVGAGVRLAARVVGFGDLMLHLAVKHGLDLDRLWPVRVHAVPSAELRDEALSAHDFLLFMDATRARAKTHDAPVLTSIIIPVFNKVEYTFQALRALLREVDLEANEVIVVNNAPRDETAQLLAHLGSLIKVINNEENRGFVDASTQCAAAARGRYLIFFNNDTQVLPDWWQSLVED